MSKISCEIIKDLLPLYYDKVCSSDSTKVVEEHIAECNNCKNELNKIKADIKLPKEAIEKNRSDSTVIKNIANLWNHFKLKSFIKGLLCATALFTGLFLAYVGLFKWNIINVPTNVVEITNLCKLANGEIAYHVKLIDGYELNECKNDMKGDGNFYVTPRRPIIKSKAIGNLGLQNMYYTFGIVENSAYKNKYGTDAEIKALYYGTPKDNILIWKKGMNVPKASKEIESEFIWGQPN